jgi:hypothetical protein
MRRQLGLHLEDEVACAEACHVYVDGEVSNAIAVHLALNDTGLGIEASDQIADMPAGPSRANSRTLRVPFRAVQWAPFAVNAVRAAGDTRNLMKSFPASGDAAFVVMAAA